MKTILYNPIFINPQAYYVFPQLYDIEKGDQFIEPAVYSGYLIIEDLISNTSSQVINTKEVDFTEFAGKRIRISWYTNLGAVILGEWLLPEGEQSGPSFHESLVDAWVMSGLSNSTKPTEIVGVKGNSLQLKNFAFTSESGFGEGTYEGALVFDGVDDYGICTGLPILDDYTVICRRKIIRIKNSSAVASKRTYPGDIGSFGAFVFERVYSHGVKTTISFGKSNDMSEFDSNEVVYQTKTSYNGTTINSRNSNDSDILCLGANAYNISLGICQEFSNVAIYYFALYNKSLTPEEVEEEKVKLENYWEGGKNELA